MKKHLCLSFQTALLTGIGSATLKIPGTFSIGAPGRYLCDASIFFGNPSVGDKINKVQVIDVDGIMPSPLRAQFPQYPILGSWEDSAVDQNFQGFFLEPSGPTKIIPSDRDNALPAGMYLSIEMQKASVGVYTAYINVVWTDLL